MIWDLAEFLRHGTAVEKKGVGGCGQNDLILEVFY